MPEVKRKRTIHKHLTIEEWRRLPITLDVHDAALAYACSDRWASDHAEELGGHKFCGRWVFPKAKVAEILGIEE